MGWTTRGTGRTYDSLSGTAALIGHYTKKVISYVTLNRKCKKCDLGRSPSDHDCRLNFEGSAKAMEPHAAVKLVNENKILKECNIQVGILIADNDSSSISAVRNACKHEVVKQADKNHTSKGVTNALYKIKKNFKELTGPVIKYLQRCFNFCISQNIGNSTTMAAAIRNIPDHCFNSHENCGASSNANESLNSVIASKAPKSKMYGMSASGDVRVACAINKKNDGEQYLVRLSEKLCLSPGKHTKKYTAKKDVYSKKKYATASTRAFKKRRLFLRKRKTDLRQKKELSEGTTYESNVGLLNLDATIAIAEITDDKPIVVLFDLETGGLSKSADILQIAAKCQNFTFSVYVKPSQKINEESSIVTGLRYDDGNLTLRGKVLETVPLLDAMIAFYEFLYLFQKKCILTAHNCNFDYSRLLKAIKTTFMDKYYQSVILGFADTLPLIRKCNTKKGRGENKLETVANNMGIDTSQAHNALDDVVILDKVLENFNITNDSIVKNVITLVDIEKKELFAKELPGALQELSALNECTSLTMRKRIIAAGISYKNISETYEEEKLVGLKKLFGKDESDQVTGVDDVEEIGKDWRLNASSRGGGGFPPEERRYEGAQPMEEDRRNA
ncbi:PREDICTED: uncharacterized protein LOC105570866, partial [Vollenhovia emeryi]|uniref:uncharacterized protein LOC105570866 n=1 Tax=Vollenhovia emeryi TaxID=411798 RepID=UPI0005F46EDA